ncbi:MAG: ankyrin repeat domain-containing protein [Candidatus Aquirickettsiella sp.]
MSYAGSQLMRAVTSGNITEAQIWIAKGASINGSTYDGDSLLALAANRCHEDMVKFLLARGANFNTVNKHGETALQFASKNGSAESVKPLIIASLLENSNTTKPHSIETKEALSIIWDSCTSEMRSLQTRRDSSVSLWDIGTTKSVNKLADMCGNEVMQEIIAKSDFIDKYPIFGNKVKENFEQGLARNDALNKAIDSASLINNDMMNLPPECSKKILKYLDKQDMDNVISAFSFFKSASAVSNTSETIKTCNVLSKS